MYISHLNTVTRSLTSNMECVFMYSTLSLPWWRCAMRSFSCRRGERDELLLKHADTAWGQSEELCTLCMLKVFACWRCVSRSREKSFVGEWRLYCESTFTYFSAYRLKLVYVTLSEITNYYKFYTHKINISTTNLTTIKCVGNKEYQSIHFWAILCYYYLFNFS